MAGITDSLRQFMNALIAAGVEPARVERAATQAPSAAALGVALVREGAATHAQVQAAQRGWAQGAPPLRAVERLGPYEVVRRLGAGAAGEVYLVRDPATGAQFAAKRLIDLGDLEERLRFQREARLLAQLDHPHLAKIHAADLEGPTPYFVLDYYAGGTLKQALAKGPLPEAQARALIDKLASALEAAHAVGVLHRDLKPENVLLDERGEPRLADFGLGLQLTAHSNRLTQTGVVLGTPSYMAPEQVQDAKRVDARSDVYGLGAVLYHCLTGRPPIPPQASLIATLYAVVGDPVQPPSSLAQVSPQLEAVCLRALEKDPDLRFATVAELRAALHTEVVARAPGQRPRRYLVLAAPLALAATGGLLLAVNHRLRPRAGVRPEPPRVAEATPEAAPLARAAKLAEIQEALEGGETRTAWELLIAVGDGEDVVPLALQLLETTESAEVLSDEGGPVTRDAIAWRTLRELRQGIRRLEDVVRSAETPQLSEMPRLRERGETLIRELEQRANDVSSRTSWPTTGDALLLQVVDLCLRARLVLQLSQARLGESALRPPPEFPHALAAVDAVATLRQRYNAPGKYWPPLRAELQRQRSSMIERCGTARPWEQRWPVFLVGQLLSEAAGGVDLERTRRWLARLEAPYPGPHNDLGKACRSLAYHSLWCGPAGHAPDVDLAAQLVDVAEELALIAEQEDRHERAWVGVVELTRGRLVSAEAALSLPSESGMPARVSLLIERARRAPQGERAPFLREASDLLRALPRRDVAAWVALKHIALLGAGEREAFDPPPERWEDISQVVPFPCPVPWYSRFDPRLHKLPGEAGPQETLWLPPLH